MFDDFTPEEMREITDLLRKTGSKDKEEAIRAQAVLAAELEGPLRSGVLTGNTIADIFNVTEFDPNARIEYPIDLYRPDNADEFTAYTIPSHGSIPHRLVQGDNITVPTYDIGNSIDYLLRYAREARWDIVSRVLEVLEAGFVKKLNDDGWHTILSAAFDRNLVVIDENAVEGQFTKRLISLAKLVMRRNAGGNSTSINRGRLTHVYLSPEAVEDMRNWGVDQLDEMTRREIYLADDGTFQRVFGVNLVDLDELGEGQEYQEYYESVIAPSLSGDPSEDGMPDNKVEIAVGLDLSKRDSFVMPIREPLEIHEDPAAHRSNTASYYSRMSAGFGVLNNVRTLLLAV